MRPGLIVTTPGTSLTGRQVRSGRLPGGSRARSSRHPGRAHGYGTDGERSATTVAATVPTTATTSSVTSCAVVGQPV